MENFRDSTHLTWGVHLEQIQFHTYNKGFVTLVYKVEAHTKTKYFIQYHN